jgi:tetratricopeptide (TPR) repeat protein
MLKSRLNKSDYVSIGLIFCFALALRLAYGAFLKQYYFFYGHPGGDVLYYQQWAREISRVDWVGTKTFWGLPLYPYFLAVLDRLALGHTGIIRFFHLLLGSVNCVLTYLIARAKFSPKIASLAGLLAGANFTLIYHDWVMMPVPLIIFLSLVIVLCLLYFDFEETVEKRDWFILGLLAGAAILGDGKFVFFSGFLLIYFIYQYRMDLVRKTMERLFPFFAAMLIVLCIVSLRNKIVGGDWVWVTAQRGLSFYVGNNSQATGIFDAPDFIRPTHGGQDEDQVMAAQVLAGKKMSPGEVCRFWHNQGMKFIRENPFACARLLGTKFKLFFTDVEDAYDLDLLLQRSWKQWLDFNPLAAIFFFAITGAVLSWRKRQGVVYLDFIILSQLLFTLIFFLTSRHRDSILPFLIIYQSCGLVWVGERIKEKSFVPVAVMAAALVCFLFILRPQVMDRHDFDFYRSTKAGAVYERRGDYSSAREQYQKALAIRPRDTNAMYNLANTYRLDGDYESAREYYEQIIRINPYQIDALYNLGYVYEEEGDPRRSLQMYQAVLALDPQSPDALLRAAQVHLSQGDCLAAQSYFNRLIEIRPNLSVEIQPLIAFCSSSGALDNHSMR